MKLTIYRNDKPIPLFEAFSLALVVFLVTVSVAVDVFGAILIDSIWR